MSDKLTSGHSCLRPLLWILEGVEHMVTVNGSKRDKAELYGGRTKLTILPRLLLAFTKLLRSVGQSAT